MPYIQVDLSQQLDADRQAALAREIVEVVHASIGSPRTYIFVAVRPVPERNLVEGHAGTE